MVRDRELLPHLRALRDLRDLRSRHNLAYWLGRDYLGLGVGAVSTIAGRRWRNTPRLAGYMDALKRGTVPRTGDRAALARRAPA